MEPVSSTVSCEGLKMHVRPRRMFPMSTKSAEAPHIRRLSEPKYVKCTESGNYKAVVKALSRAVTSGMLPKGWVFVEGFPSLPLPGIFGPSLDS